MENRGHSDIVEASIPTATVSPNAPARERRRRLLEAVRAALPDRVLQQTNCQGAHCFVSRRRRSLAGAFGLTVADKLSIFPVTSADGSRSRFCHLARLERVM